MLTVPAPAPERTAVQPESRFADEPTSAAAGARAANADAEQRVPEYLWTPIPDYPALARQHRWEGEAWVQVQVDSGGEVTAVNLERSSGYSILDRAALRQVRTWRFRPAMHGGIPVPAEVTVPVRFVMDRPGPTP